MSDKYLTIRESLPIGKVLAYSLAATAGVCLGFIGIPT